jgi:flagellar assembly protein FliH
MLCSIYRENEVEVREAPWKQKRSLPAAALRERQSGQFSSGNVTQLPSRTDELSLARDQQAAEQKVKEAWEQGRLAGEVATKKSLDDQVRVALEGLARTVAEVASARADTIRRAEGDTVRLAVEIARRVLHRELSLDSSALEALIKAAITKLGSQEIYRVRVHPEQAALMRACLEQEGKGTVEVLSDMTQPKGGVSFEISRGTLDASVDTQLREIENGLADQIRRRT